LDFRDKNKYDIPLVTIGVLSYNNAGYLTLALNSILNQSYRHIELIIIEDASVDNSLNIINKWIKDQNVVCTLISHEKNYGICKGCNDIIINAKGKYIVIFGSDDIMYPLRIEKQVGIMEQSDDSYAFCYSGFDSIDEQGELIGRKQYMVLDRPEGNCFEDFYFRKFFIAAPTVLIKKGVFSDVGLYNERLVTEDYGMWMKILPFYNIRFCNYKGVRYRVIKKAILGDKERMKTVVEQYHRDRVLIYTDVLKRIKNTSEFKAISVNMINKINFHLIRLRLAKSIYFKEAFRFCILNRFYNISFFKLLKVYIRQAIINEEANHFLDEKL
jgi:glycosyltransferase involved in cell wall biosynthesis